MLPKINRLPLRRELIRMKEQGKRIPGKSLDLVLVPTKPSDLPRLAFIVSAKIFRKSVERNLMKRRISESIRPILTETKGGFDGLIIVRKELAAAKQVGIQTEIRTMFEKEGLLKGR